MIIDDTLEMLERIKNAVNRQGPSAEESPHPDENASIKIGLETDAARLREEAAALKNEFLNALSAEQETSYAHYQQALKENFKADRGEKPHPPKEIEFLHRAFLKTLNPTQKNAYAQWREAHNKWRETYREMERLKIMKMLFGLRPSDIKTIATVAFPESFTSVQRYAVDRILTALTEQICVPEGDGKSAFTFCHEYANNTLARLRIEAAQGKEEALPLILQKLESALPVLRERMADESLWEKVRTSRGMGYRYISPLNDWGKDPLFAAANSLAGHNHNYHPNDSGLFVEKDGELITEDAWSEKQKAAMKKDLPRPEAHPCIVLTGEAAQDILGKNFGIDLKKIKEAPRRDR